MTASTALCRIMCAAAATYSIDVGGCGLPPSTDPYYQGSGLADSGAGTQVFCGGSDNINACLVGRTEDGVVVAFRGTLGFNLSDWASIVDWFQDVEGMKLVPAAELGAGVEVHRGWWTALGTLWPGASAYAKQLLDDGGGPLLITGHSKGGPLAAMAAACFNAQLDTAAQVTTFASPNPGNDAFAALFGGAGQPTSINYENYGDIVPLVPPTGDEAWQLMGGFIDELDLKTWEKVALGAALLLIGTWGYAPVNGTEYYVQHDGTVVTPSALEARVADLLANYNSYGGPSAFAAAHCHACYCEDKGVVACAGGYMKAACPDGEICDEVGTTCPDG